MKKWYVLKVKGGRGSMVKKVVEKRVEIMDLKEEIEEVFYGKDFREYVFVKMEDVEKVEKVFKGIEGCFGFLKVGDEKEVIKEEEMKKMM